MRRVAMERLAERPRPGPAPGVPPALHDVQDFEGSHGLLLPLVPALQDAQQGDLWQRVFSSGGWIFLFL